MHVKLLVNSRCDL